MAQRAQDPTAPTSPQAQPSATPASGSAAAPDEVPDEQTPTEALHDIGTRLSELSEYFGYLIAAKVDAIKVSLRHAGIYAALGILALLAGGALVVTAVVLML